MRLIIISFVFLILSCATKVKEKPVYIEKPVIVEKPIYIKPNIPELPERPKLESPEFFKLGDKYCVDIKGVKILLKNLYKLDNYARELETILIMLRKEYNIDNDGRN